MEKSRRIDRYGLEAVTGRRVFYHHEFLCLITAENIVNAYHSRKHSQNWAAWALENPRLAEILSEIEKQNANSSVK